jgi:hypothetical protein
MSGSLYPETTPQINLQVPYNDTRTPIFEVTVRVTDTKVLFSNTQPTFILISCVQATGYSTGTMQASRPGSVIYFWQSYTSGHSNMTIRPEMLLLTTTILEQALSDPTVKWWWQLNFSLGGEGD